MPDDILLKKLYSRMNMYCLFLNFFNISRESSSHCLIGGCLLIYRYLAYIYENLAYVEFIS